MAEKIKDILDKVLSKTEFNPASEEAPQDEKGDLLVKHPEAHESIHKITALQLAGIEARMYVMFEMILGIEDLLSEFIKLVDESSLSKDKKIKNRLAIMNKIANVLQTNITYIRKILDEEKTAKMNIITLKKVPNAETIQKPQNGKTNGDPAYG